MSALRSTAVSDPFNAKGMRTRYPTETSTHLVFVEHTEPEALLSSSHTPFVWCPLEPRKENLFNQFFVLGFIYFSVTQFHLNMSMQTPKTTWNQTEVGALWFQSLHITEFL